MNKGQLIDAIADRVSAAVTKKQIVEAVLTATFEVIQDAVAEGDKVTIVGFGSWELRDRQAREGRNPATGEPIAIPATKAPCFSAGKQFKDLVNGK